MGKKFRFQGKYKHYDGTLHVTLCGSNEKEAISVFYKKFPGVELISVSEIYVNGIEGYAKVMSNELNSFLDNQGIYANTTIYNINKHNPLMLIKISFEHLKKDVNRSNECLECVLNSINKVVLEKKSKNIYFIKKLNYRKDNCVYIIRPNKRRFWLKSRALEDASDLILVILSNN